ncbi:MAG: hypothetical protein AAF346_10100 [Pseudomonadota bacterium]
MNTSKFIAIAAAAPMVIGVALTAPAVAAPFAASKLQLLTTSPKAQVQDVHCRRFVHAHRRCTLWRGGVCRRWVTYRHRCG